MPGDGPCNSEYGDGPSEAPFLPGLREEGCQSSLLGRRDGSRPPEETVPSRWTGYRLMEPLKGFIHRNVKRTEREILEEA